LILILRGSSRDPVKQQACSVPDCLFDLLIRGLIFQKRQKLRGAGSPPAKKLGDHLSLEGSPLVFHCLFHSRLVSCHQSLEDFELSLKPSPVLSQDDPTLTRHQVGEGSAA